MPIKRHTIVRKARKGGPFMPAMDAEVLAAHLHEEMAEMLALLPCVRRSAKDAACVDALSRCAYRQLRCAQNLAAYAQLCGTPPIARSFCLSALAEGFLQGARSICPHAHFTVNLPAAPLWAAGSARLCAVCLGNLLCNSLLYAGEAPSITVAVEVQGESAVLRVADDGKGFRPEQLERAFEPFLSADPYGDGAPAPGLGLGLAVVQRYAAACGGCLVAHSEFGAGSTLALRMPRTSPVCAKPAVPCFVTDRCSTLYTQLSPVCRLPV